MTSLSSTNGQLLETVDAAAVALERHDHLAASRQYARASELLFGESRASRDAQRKSELSRLAQRMLANAFALRGEPVPAELSGTATVAHQLGRRGGFTFDDVAGLEEVKETLRLRVIYPLKHPGKVDKYGLRAGGGVLLYGPPGTGKTMIARAVAGELALPFFVVKSSEILGQYIGESEKHLAAVFTEARAAKQGAVIFVDEIDALAASRSAGTHEASRRLLNQLLQELDGIDADNRGLLFLAATNEPWLLDSAVMRPGRFDEKCLIPLPDLAARRKLLELQLAGCPLAADVDLDHIAARSEGYSGADVMCLCERAKQLPFREAVLQGSDRLMQMSDFAEALVRVRRSVSEEVVRRFHEFAHA